MLWEIPSSLHRMPPPLLLSSPPPPPPPTPPCVPSTDRSITFFSPFVPPLFWLLCLSFCTSSSSSSRSRPSAAFHIVLGFVSSFSPLAHLRRRAGRFPEFTVSKPSPAKFGSRAGEKRSRWPERSRGRCCKSAASAFPQQLVASCCTSASHSSVTGTLSD